MNNRPAKINTTQATKTLRDEFAMAALSGFLASEEGDSCFVSELAARRSYDFADAMLAAREAAAPTDED